MLKASKYLANNEWISSICQQKLHWIVRELMVSECDKNKRAYYQYLFCLHVQLNEGEFLHSWWENHGLRYLTLRQMTAPYWFKAVTAAPAAIRKVHVSLHPRNAALGSDLVRKKKKKHSYGLKKFHLVEGTVSHLFDDINVCSFFFQQFQHFHQLWGVRIPD